MNRQEFYKNFFSARALFVTGLLIIPALLFNPSTEYRIIQFLFFGFLAWLFGRKINFLFTVLVTLFIIFFNLLIPYGRILFSAGFFSITSGALEAGIHRAVTLQALVMLSKITIRQDLKMPGTFGGLLGESLRIFSVLISKKLRMPGKNLIEKIDSLLLELSKEELSMEAAQISKTKPAGYAALVIIIFLSWFPWLMFFKKCTAPVQFFIMEVL